MSFTSCNRSSYFGFSHLLDAQLVSFDALKSFNLLAVALTAVTLAACAGPSLAPARQGSLESHQASFGSNRHLVFVAKEHPPLAMKEQAKETGDESYGLASFYENGSATASGERFNADELTAAHRTLPFGTRVRVTNHSNGRTVVVRINDRGPFVHGRIIDVTPAAAHALGMSGLAPVTVERE
jgi:rare lipoprotein A